MVLCATTLIAQSAIVPVGGDVQNANGSVSYTVGQISVQTSGNSIWNCGTENRC